MANVLRTKVYLVLITICFSNVVRGQNIDTLASPTLNHSIEQLLTLPRKSAADQEIISASKKAESLFEAPLASSVLTSEEIESSGATNLMEAMRLLPGLVVRQISNGNYDIHIRGMDWLPHVAEEDILAGVGRLLLVMVDGRPVYNYFLGNTDWETIPVSLNDIERIELVRGASSSLFGPNAVTGVINIITKKPEKEGLYFQSRGWQGNYDHSSLSMAIGYKKDDKFDVIISGNAQSRDRTTDQIYSKSTDSYQLPQDISFYSGTISGIEARDTFYPFLNLSQQKNTANVFMNYRPFEKVNVAVKAGMESSKANSIRFPDFDVFMTQNSSQSSYAELALNIGGFNFQGSYLSGQQDLVKGVLYRTDRSAIATEASYTWIPIEGLSIIPAFSFRKSTYSHPIDDSQVLNSSEKVFGKVVENIDPTLPPEQAIPFAIGQAFALPLGIITQNSGIDNLAYGVRADYTTKNEKLRLIAGIRSDQFTNVSSQAYFSYQLASTFKLSSKHLLRGNISQAYASQYVIETQVTLAEPTNIDLGDFSLPGLRLSVGRNDVDPIVQQSYEIGYRGKINDKFSVDVEGFRGIVSNLRSTIKDSVSVNLGDPILPNATIYQNYKNLPHRVVQQGVTFSLNYVSRNIWIRSFMTWQQTKVKDYSYSFSTSEFVADYSNLTGDNTGFNENLSTISTDNTPSWFGGIYANYKINSRLSSNLSLYFMSNQIYRRNVGDGDNMYNVNSRIIANLRISYDFNRNTSAFMSLRDWSNSAQAEYFYTDPIRKQWLAGFIFDLK